MKGSPHRPESPTPRSDSENEAAGRFPAGGASDDTAGNSVVVAMWTMVSRVTGLLKTIAVAAVLGPTYLGNLFQATNLLPNLVYTLLAGTLFSTLLVPSLVRQACRDDRRQVERLACGFLGMVTVVFLGVTVMVILLGPLLLRLLASGVEDAVAAEGQRRLGMPLLVMLMPQVVLYGVAGTGAAVMNAHGRFGLAAAAPALENLGVATTMGALVVFYGAQPSLETVEGPALSLLGLGTTASVGLHAFVLWWGARKVGVRMVPRVDWRQPEMRALVGRMLPSLGSAAVVVVRGFVVLVVANQVAGGVVAFQLALGFFYLPTALGARPVAVALLPRLSGLWQTGNVQAFRDELVQSVALVIFLVVPAALAMVVLSGSLASAVSVGAMAGSTGVALVTASLVGLGLGVLGDSGFILATNAAYARDDAVSPLRSTVLGTAVAFPVMAWALFLVDGTAVLLLLGLSLSIGNLTATWHLWTRLQDQLPSGPDHLLGSLFKAIGASTVMVVPAYAIAASLPEMVDGGQLGHVLGLLAAASLGLAVYVGLHRIWRSEELVLLSRSWGKIRPGNLG